jgi:hypothetical protein
MRRPRTLELLGQASLPVFCAHLLLVLLALTFFGAAHADRSWALDAAILGASFAVLYAVAQVSAAIDRRAAVQKAAGAAARELQRTQLSAGA